MLMQLSIAVLLAVASGEVIQQRSYSQVRENDIDLCGHTCQQVISMGAPCTTKWEQGCYGINPPLGFTSQSTLYELCPNQCPEPCTQANKAKSIYGEPKYNPELKYNYVKEAYTTVKATLVEPLRRHNRNGIYEATMMHTTQKDGSSGASGYFGVQWKGATWENDMLLFSIWDKKSGSTVTSYALPNHPNCKRNCNDCFEEETTGTKCYFNLPQLLQEGDELMLKVEREPVESLAYGQNQYKGHVWKVKLSYVSGPNKANFMNDQFGLKRNEEFVIGRILFADDNLALGEESIGGINGFSMFHEHIGCTPCDSFAFEVDRFGPYVTKAIDNDNLPELLEGDATFTCSWDTLGDCTCRSFDVKSFSFGGFRFQTGPGYSPHWEDLRSKSKMYWTDGDKQHARDEGQDKPECQDELPTKRCEQRKALGKCLGNKKCKKTCGLCD